MGVMDYDEFDVDRNDLIVVLGGYLYLNMSLTRLFGVRFPGLTPEMVDFQYFGEMPGIPTYASEARPTDESPVHTERLAQALGWIFSRDDLPELRDDREQIARLVARRPDIAELDLQEVVDYGRSHLPLLRRLLCRHLMMSATSGIGIAVVHQVCEAIGQPELTLTLIAGLGDVDSAAPSWAMWDLSRMVAASAELTAAFDAGVTGLLDRIRGLAERGDGAATKWLGAWDLFQAQFESRGPNEWELRSPTWGTKPALPLAAIDRMRLAADADSPQVRSDIRVAAREQATAAVREALAANPEALGQFDAGLRAAALFNAGRERSKTNCVRVLHEVRLAALELGRRLIEAWRAARAAARVHVRRRRARRPGGRGTGPDRLGQARPGGWRPSGRRSTSGCSTSSRRSSPRAIRRRRASGRAGARPPRRPRWARRWRASRAARAWPPDGRGSSTTLATPAASSRATCSSRRSPTRPGHRCSCRRPRSWSTSGPRSATPSS